MSRFQIMPGRFIISLDFELMWGVFDILTIEQYGENIKNVHIVIPKLLDLFDKYNICATFSTVGFLFAENKKMLLKYSPELKPSYQDHVLSPYGDYLNTIGDNEDEDPFHYGVSLIKQIKQKSGHEIGTHTFCHYYCLEPGQKVNEFEADLIAAKSIALEKNIIVTSIVFPRNQVNAEYLDVCKKHGIMYYRGQETAWMYKAQSSKDESLLKRFFRILDTYVNISGYNCYDIDVNNTPINVPSSRFLRPYNPSLKFFEQWRLKRILNAMTYAAKNNLSFHLWWHPHNFGKNIDENFEFLEEILKHYHYLHNNFNFRSCAMSTINENV